MSEKGLNISPRISCDADEGSDNFFDNNNPGPIDFDKDDDVDDYFN